MMSRGCSISQELTHASIATHTHTHKKKFSIPVADSEGTSGTVTNHGTTPHPSNFDHVELLHLSACHFEFILHEEL